MLIRKRGAYFKFWRIGGALIRVGALIRGFTASQGAVVVRLVLMKIRGVKRTVEK